MDTKKPEHHPVWLYTFVVVCDANIRILFEMCKKNRIYFNYFHNLILFFPASQVLYGIHLFYLMHYS